MTAPMPETMKCPKCSYRSGDDWEQCNGACPMPGSPHYTAALASSGDHAELIGRLRKVESGQDDGFLPGAACTNWYRNPEGPAAADALEALIAEVAALREQHEVDMAEVARAGQNLQSQRIALTEAERKLAAAVGLKHLTDSRLFKAINAAVTITKYRNGVERNTVRISPKKFRTFLSKEAERG